MTQDEARAVVAVKYFFVSWTQLLRNCINTGNLEAIYKYTSEAAELYASQKWTEACTQQLEALRQTFADPEHQKELSVVPNYAIAKAIAHTITKFPHPPFNP